MLQFAIATSMLNMNPYYFRPTSKPLQRPTLQQPPTSGAYPRERHPRDGHHHQQRPVGVRQRRLVPEERSVRAHASGQAVHELVVWPGWPHPAKCWWSGAPEHCKATRSTTTPFAVCPISHQQPDEHRGTTTHPHPTHRHQQPVHDTTAGGCCRGKG